MQRRKIEAAHRRYEHLLRSGAYCEDENRTFFDEETGGFIVVHRGHMTDGLEGELQTAHFYAAQGMWVRLLDETGQGPFADAHHGGPLGDGLDWDYKTAEAGGNPRSQVQSAISSGKRPSGNIVIRFEERYIDVNLLNRGVNAALRHDRERPRTKGLQPLVRRVVILFPTPQGYFEERRTTEEFIHGKQIFRGPEGDD